MKFAGLSIFASAVMAVSLDLGRRETPLDVKLEMLGNSNVKATITNTGATALKLFKTGTILDANNVEKAEVFTGSEKIAFDGLRLRISTQSLDEAGFQTIAPGEAVETEFDVAIAHDLSAGGDVTIASTGAFSYAEEGTTEIAGAVPFSSNVINTAVDGVAAAHAKRDYDAHLKRSVLQSTCTGTKGTATRNSFSNCRSFAAAASSAAASGSAAKIEEYFKSSSSSTRSTVAGVFARVVTECGSTTSGVARQYCSDPLGACSSGVLAYTQPSASLMAHCDLFYSALPATTGTCHAQDQATTTLHEVTHLTQIRGTSDQNGCYGYSCVRSLSASQNLNHADTYALFANAIRVGC